jgi:acetyl-CoA carboxylase carboxyl transferase beta subunit
VEEAVLAASLYVCPACHAHLSMPAAHRITQLADARSFREWDRGLVSVDPLRFADRRPYRERLAEARQATGLREAVVTGQATLDGQPFVLVVFDFRFLGGSMGSAVGEKVARAFERATRKRLPVIAVTASGGAWMQEGMLSLLHMAKTAAAAGQHHAAGLPYVAVLSDPTFGGVAASFGVRGISIFQITAVARSTLLNRFAASVRNRSAAKGDSLAAGAPPGFQGGLVL